MTLGGSPQDSVAGSGAAVPKASQGRCAFDPTSASGPLSLELTLLASSSPTSPWKAPLVCSFCLSGCVT